MADAQKIFEYSLRDARDNLISQISVFKGEKNFVCFKKNSFKSGKRASDSGTSFKSIEISNSALKKIQEVVDDPILYSFSDISDESPEYMVSDGYRNEIYFHSDGKTNHITIPDLSTYGFNPDRSLHATSVLMALTVIKEILIAEGIDSKYFDLEK